MSDNKSPNSVSPYVKAITQDYISTADRVVQGIYINRKPVQIPQGSTLNFVSEDFNIMTCNVFSGESIKINRFNYLFSCILMEELADKEQATIYLKELISYLKMCNIKYTFKPTPNFYIPHYQRSFLPFLFKKEKKLLNPHYMNKLRLSRYLFGDTHIISADYECGWLNDHFCRVPTCRCCYEEYKLLDHPDRERETYEIFFKGRKDEKHILY